VADDLAGVMGKRLSSLRQADAAPTSFQQRNAACQLHLAQAVARCSERESDLLRAAGDAASVGNSKEKAKIGEVKAHREKLTDKPAFGPAEGGLRQCRIVEAGACAMTEQ
jgi:hypothetical protein